MAERTTVNVDNRGFPDVVVYLLNGGARYRLGTVNGNSSETFALPHAFVPITGSVQLLARPIGGRRAYLLPAVMVSTGQQVAVTLMEQAAHSFVSVWDR